MLVTWKYRERKSFIQSFDPRAWIIFYAGYLVGSVLFWDLRIQAGFFLLALLVVVTSGITWTETRRAWLFIGGFVIFFAFLTFLTGRGGIEFYEEEHVIRQFQADFTLFGWRPTLTITVERSVFAITQLFRVFGLASMTILIPYSLNPAHYGVTFRGLGLPDKVAYAMDLTMRFIPTFGRDFQLTMDAQRARGYELEKVKMSLFAQVRRLAPLIVPVTIHAIIGSEDIIDSMDLRGFGVRPRTWIQILEFKNRDYVLMFIAIVLLTSSVGLSLLGVGKFWIPPSLIR